MVQCYLYFRQTWLHFLYTWVQIIHCSHACSIHACCAYKVCVYSVRDAFALCTHSMYIYAFMYSRHSHWKPHDLHCAHDMLAQETHTAHQWLVSHISRRPHCIISYCTCFVQRNRFSQARRDPIPFPVAWYGRCCHNIRSALSSA